MMSALFESLVNNSMTLLPLELDNENPLEGGELENYARAGNKEGPQFKLQLDDKDVNLEELEDLMEYFRLKTVRELWLDRNDFGDEGVGLLSEAKALTGLRVLSLAGNKLTDSAFCALASSKTLVKLKR